MDVSSGRSSSSGEKLFVAVLQSASTPCVILGSAVALAGSWNQEPGTARPTHLELGAAGLLALSLLLEALAFLHRRSSQKNEEAPPSASCEQRPRQPAGCGWPQLLLLLGPTVAMGSLTALGGPSAARQLGIVPRTWSGLPGIVLGCFVHFNWYHFMWNALAFLLLGLIVFRATSSYVSDLGDRRRGEALVFAAVSLFIAISSGFCVWCLARPALHAGASGVVCGYAGLLLALTLRRRDVPLVPLLMVLAVVACYGSAAFLGSQQRAGYRGSPCQGIECFYGRSSLYEACTSRTTSAEHHTFGFLSGLASALFFCEPGRRQQHGRGIEPRAETKASVQE
mmetsp:Transcript_38786/g.60376  ORF Transcript_38786/g.60376 Transcript_38786/m.60376 type:complete len:339 (-) Transcript_38786:141-1157(-)